MHSPLRPFSVTTSCEHAVSWGRVSPLRVARRRPSCFPHVVLHPQFVAWSGAYGRKGRDGAVNLRAPAPRARRLGNTSDRSSMEPALHVARRGAVLPNVRPFPCKLSSSRRCQWHPSTSGYLRVACSRLRLFCSSPASAEYTRNEDLRCGLVSKIGW